MTRRELVDLNAIARDATTGLVAQALSKKIDLGFEGLDKGYFLWGDGSSLYELCSNLIENAILYTQEGGKVTVRLNTAEQPSLIVEDNGPGIPDDERERVFERFYRALGTSVDGSGLGLAIVREIAEIHGGSVVLDGGPDGKGTSALVKFPRTIAAGAAPRTPPPFQGQDEGQFVRPVDPPFVRF
jgi:two-component system sensor histidine kinase TctE